MKINLYQKKIILFASIMFFLSGQSTQAALIGTELGIQTVFQQTSTPPRDVIGFLTTATVVEPGVEFTSLASTQVINPPFGLQVVDVAINAGDDFLEIDFDNVTHTSFSPAFLNGYIFTFDSAALIDITSATIDTSVTTLGLTQSDLSFLGNQLIVNVEGLSFNTSTFARINLTSEPSPVPVPTAIWLFGSGIIGLLGMKKRYTIKQNTNLL